MTATLAPSPPVEVPPSAPPATSTRAHVARPRGAVLTAALLYSFAVAALVWATLRPVWVPVDGFPARYGVVVGVGWAIGALAAAGAALWRRGAATVTMLAAAGYLVAAVTLAIPAAARAVRAGDVDAILRGLIEAVRAPVTGWKDVVTLPVPLGEYGATLAVPLALAVVSAAVIVTVGASDRRWALAAAAGGASTAVAIAVGPATRTEWADLPRGLGAVSGEMVLGLAALALALAWVRWRMADARRQALRAVGGGVRGERAPARTAGRVVAASTVIAAAVAVALAVAAPVGEAAPRDVARTVVEPALVVDRAVTPLASYRAFLGDGLYDVPLFTVTGVEGDLTRIRVATLPYFDGRSFTAVAPAGYTPARFQRVPSALPVVGAATVAATVTIEALEGPWAPLPGALGDATLAGPRAAELVDAFYYSPGIAAAVVSLDGGLAAGDSLSAVAAPFADGTLAGAGPSPGAAGIDPELIPESLRAWVEEQGVTRDGAGLAMLIDRLRARGYLSHALTLDGTPRWVADLGDYAFEPSMAGHSYDRIDRLFAAMLEREAQAGTGAADAMVVAAVGDDEQFAAAAALLATELGFPARVVVGARLADTDPRGWAAEPCPGGVCRGRHMAVWTEVRAASGEWIAVDVTPQHEIPVTPAVATQRDPRLPSATDPDRAEAIDAVASLKGRSGGGEPPTAVDAPDPWLTDGMRVALVAGVLSLLVLGPPLAVAAAKAVRRGRRRRGTPTEVVQGGWDEYVDAAIDSRVDPPARATRLEFAAACATRHGTALAVLADRATFAEGGIDVEDARLAWELVRRERAELLARRPRWRRLGTRLSTRSLLRKGAALGAPREADGPAQEHWRALPVRSDASSTRARR